MNAAAASLTGQRSAAGRLTNEDGHLNCDWKEVPPPRVGRISFGKNRYGRQSADEACRYVDHISFVAPQYKRPADPIAAIPTLNRTIELNHTHTLQNISGQWTSFSKDGALLVAQVRPHMQTFRAPAEKTSCGNEALGHRMTSTSSSRRPARRRRPASTTGAPLSHHIFGRCQHKMLGMT